MCPARFTALVCGRRSGKTELCKRRLVYWLGVDRGHGLQHEYRAAAPTLQQARALYWQDLKDLTPPSWITDINESRLEIHTRVQNVEACVKVIGLEKAQRSEGQGWDGICIDESSDVRDGIWARSILPALADRQGWAVRLGVPKRFGCSTEYRDFCQLGFSGKDPNIQSFTWPSWTVLPDEEIQLQKSILSEDDFNEQFGAQWVDTGGVLFHAYDPNVHIRPCSYNPQKPLLVGTDYNVSPMAWVMAHSDGQTLEVFDELFLNNTNTQATLDVLWGRYSQHQGGFIFFGDATSKARHTSASASDYAQIKNDKRFRARLEIPAANPPIRDRVASCNALLRNAAGEVRCWIDPRCTHLLADLKKRGFDKDGNPAEGKPNDPIGHASDSWGYLVHSRWPSTRLFTGIGKATVIPD